MIEASVRPSEPLKRLSLSQAPLELMETRAIGVQAATMTAPWWNTAVSMAQAATFRWPNSRWHSLTRRDRPWSLCRLEHHGAGTVVRGPPGH